MAHDETASWLVLQSTPGIGGRTLRRLVNYFGSAAGVLEAQRRDLLRAGLPERLIGALRRPDESAARTGVAWLDDPAHHLVTFLDPRYPPLLRQIDDPPPLLFVRGDVAALHLPQLAIVGSRNPSASGSENAFLFARQFARCGFAVTSGLAVGIDAAAHRGALDGDGVTVAVAGTGIDRIYPARHATLADEIVTRGALVSEFPLGTPPAAGNFPRRNRLISGLSVGVLVVEAARHSGSLVTARLAAEQGREVFAIPGSIHNPLARGCHALIRQGGKLVETVHDILEELGPLANAALELEVPLQQDSPPPPPPSSSSSSEDHGRLLQCIGFDPVSVDGLVERSGLTAERVSSMLLMLEMQGHISPVPGGLYARRRERA